MPRRRRTKKKRGMKEEEPEQKKVKTGRTTDTTSDEVERVAEALRERLVCHDTNRKEVQERLHKACEKQRRDVDEMEEKELCELEKRFCEEINRINEELCEVCERSNGNDDNDNDIYRLIK